MQEAILLSELCEKVYVVQNLDYFTGEQKLVEQLNKKPNVETILGTTVKAINGETELESIVGKCEATGETTELKIDGMFVAIGLIPQNDMVKDLIKLNDYGYVEAGEDCVTNKNGIFVAGDCRSKRVRQVATAVGDGAVAALAACDYIDSL